MMTASEFFALVALLPYVRVLSVSTCVSFYFDECYDERHDLTDEEQERFDEVYDLLICRGLYLTDAVAHMVDSPDGSDSWDD